MSDQIEVMEASRLRPKEVTRPQPIERPVGDLSESDFRRRPSPVDRFESYRFHGVTFLVMVVLPTLVAMLYYGLWASDQYAAEVRFGVRQTQEPNVSDDVLSMMAKGLAVGTTGREPYLVASYVRSRNLVEDLDRQIGLREIYSRPVADWFARFDPRGSSEKLWSYWRRMVVVNTDRLSGLVTVRALAFTPDDAVTIVRAIQANAEHIVDQTAQRIRADALHLAEEDLARARQRYVDSLLALRRVREGAQTVDPEKAIEETAKTLTEAMRQKLALERDLAFNMKVVSSSAPQIQVLNQRIRAVDEQIAALNRSLTSRDEADRTAADVISRFEERELARRFSEKLMEITQSGYERARVEEARQHMYLTTFVEPIRPDLAEYPKRARTIGFVAVFALVVWVITLILIAAVKDHRLVSSGYTG
jgi:capsular polysaccharide transport system permease protein